MSSLYRDEGVVLRTWKLGEADRIVVVLTRGHGKVRAVAKGVRKTRSKFGARLEPTTNVALQFYEGRELDIVTQAETIDYFRSIRDDLDRFSRASAMLEAVDQLAQEREVNIRLYQMLLGALRTLAAKNAPLVVPAFFFKLLALEGYRPIVEHCAECGADDGLVAFDVDAGGMLCRDDRRGTAMTPDAVALLQRILGGQLGSALEADESSATHQLDDLATHAVEHHLERRLRSVTVLHRA
ncbi:MAG: DNA repair protein RecO [Actinobacteria bacterium]|nr:DNA repair protein RecO [Actinomycetota bacterium]